MPQTSEKAFESYVEQMLLSKGWQQGSVSNWDKEQALFPGQIIDFIAASQPQLWEMMRGQQGEELETMLLVPWSKNWPSRECCMSSVMASSFTARFFVWPISSPPMA